MEIDLTLHKWNPFGANHKSMYSLSLSKKIINT